MEEKEQGAILASLSKVEITMSIKKWLATFPLMGALAVMALAPVASTAAGSQNAQGTSTAQLNAMGRDARGVARSTASLENLANSPRVQQSMQDKQLRRIQARLDDMNSRLNGLEAAKASLPRSDQRTIDQLSSLTHEMTAETRAAIGDLHSGIPYKGYAQVLNQEARTVARDVNSRQSAL